MGRVADPSRVSGFSAPHCGSLRASDEGHELELYGWVARRRDHGGLIFIDLRDRWGAVQVVFNPTNAPDAHAADAGAAPSRRPGDASLHGRQRVRGSRDADAFEGNA